MLDDLDVVHPRQYPLPKLVLVEWRRGNRRQHAVGFLIANNGTHLVLCDQFDGKHPDRRRLWTIDGGDVVEEQSLHTFAELDFVVSNAAVEATTRFMERAIEGEGGPGQEYEGLMNAGLRPAEAGEGRTVTLRLAGPHVTANPNATASPSGTDAGHSHEWGRLKACPPDGDMGRECRFCFAVEFDR